MTLTSGRGPLSPNRAGRFTAPLPADVAYVEPFGRRLRGIKGGSTVVDSEAVLLVHRSGQRPVWAFPAGDVRGVEATAVPEAPGHVEVDWRGVDEWYEEDERLVGHPRNPYHRVDCVRTSRPLRVEIDGTVLVDTTRTMAVFETSLARRLYVGRDDVRMDLLEPSDTRTHCPYKGFATYWHAVVDGRRVDDVAWAYEDPLPESLPIAGMLSFYEDRATVVAG